MINHCDAGKEHRQPQPQSQRRRQKWLWKLLFCSISFACIGITSQHYMIEVFNTSNKEGHGILDQAINIPNIQYRKSLNEKKNVL
jgi:hypothetical protein